MSQDAGQSKDTEAFRDKIATVDESGKRNWIYPKKPSGRFYNARTWLSFLLLAILFGMPFIQIDGQPFMLFNILERKFILFGIPFMPQDFHLFVLAMITLIVFIILFTVVFGRLFCGWVCPQTIFMEMVFRKIEYWIEGDANAQRRLAKAPWTREKYLKKGAKFAIFFAIAVLVANTFLSYIIGVEEVFQLATEPVSQNLGGFIAMLLFSGVFFFVFAYMREQVCIAVCPYGRLQGVLLDSNSIVVHYDFDRGEPRGKLKKSKRKKKQVSPTGAIAAAVAEGANSPEAAVDVAPIELGDCIDCGMCVRVCPTGIDIRDGTQLECVNCTACIDACDEIMDKVGRPRGLIRYDSYNGIVEKRKKLFTPRVLAYSGVLIVLLALNFFLLSQRNDVEALLLRTPGQLYQKLDDGQYRNLYNYQIVNKTRAEMPIRFVLTNVDGTLTVAGNEVVAKPEGLTKGVLMIDLPKPELNGRKTKIKVEVYSGEKLVDRTTTNFFGPN